MARPVKYRAANDIEAKAEDYFQSCWVDKVTETTDKDGKVTMSTVTYQNRPYTVTGLALHLGLTRKGLIDYQHKSKEFCNTITRAKQKVEMFYEESLVSAKSSHGVEFALKNNFGWVDKQEHELSGKDGAPIEFTFNIHPDAAKGAKDGNKD
jgi:hypothetical protein